MELDQQFGLPAVLGAITSSAEYEHHRLLTLQFRETAPRGGVVCEFVVGEKRTGPDVMSHGWKAPFSGFYETETRILAF